jgi:HSP20 family protein
MTAVTGDESSFGICDPALDIEETGKEYVVVVDLPAMKTEDIKVRVRDGVLTIEGERRLGNEAKGRTVHRLERQYGRFVRHFRVPGSVDAAAVRAEYSNGVLQVRLPKSAASRPAARDVKVT